MDTFDTKPGLYHQDGDHGAGDGDGVADDSGVVGVSTYLIFVIFFTQPQFETWKFYT